MEEKALKILEILKKEYPKYNKPVSTYFQDTTNNSFKVLISTILSPRAKDSQTEKVSKALFEIADTPEQIVKLKEEQLEKIVYSIGFYKVKSKRVKQACLYLIKYHKSEVPKSLEELTKIPGVGRKVANIILAECFNIPAIAVDTHVMTISIRLGFVKKRTPLKVEKALMNLFPSNKWKEINKVLVAHGQNICTPLYPKCSVCPIYSYCPRNGVNKHR
ncbi:endonuclease III [Candidatus Woesearchaeota archaeon]|nr:endonuclease III [Candidatus Woesearchaeota archaeon]